MINPDSVLRVLTTCPRDCYDGCGMEIELLGGAVRRVGGNKAHPVSRGKLCEKCTLAYNSTWLDRAARLTRPLVRDSSKGVGRFEPVSWDVALDLVAERISEAVRTCGARSVVHAHYTGTCGEIAGKYPLRFLRALGATEVDPDTVCNKAGHVALEYMFGRSTEGFDPRTAALATSIFVWGVNPAHSAPRTFETWLKTSGARIVVVDPIRSETAAAADLHLRPYPGSDAALAFSLLHILHRDGRLDRTFIERHVQGYEEVEPLVTRCTPSWGEDVTGVPSGLIEEAARYYGSGTSLLWLGQGFQRQPKGGNAVRACALLPALTGYLGRPGGGFCYLNDTKALATLEASEWSAWRDESLATDPLRISHMDLTAVLEDPGRSRVFITWNMNPLASCPRQDQLRRALTREDLFVVTIDCFPTDTTSYSDVVLPAAMFLEFDDLVWNYFHPYLGAQVGVMEPPGESLPNQEIFRRLATTMGMTDPELHRSDREVIDDVLGRLDPPISFEELKSRGWLELGSRRRVQFEGLVFPTPSGKIEVASPRAEIDGHPRVPQPHADAKPSDGLFRLLSPASRWLLNSTFGNVPRATERLGPESVIIHPADAMRLDILDDSRVRLENTAGWIELSAKVSDETVPGVLLSYKGRWPNKTAGGSNVNAVNPGDKSDMGESSAVHGVEVRLTPLV
jgi:anaerobic selenocysteine-containing dehydrogenase